MRQEFPDGPRLRASRLLVYDCVAIGPGKELNALTKSFNAKYGITGLGEVRRVLGMLPERSLLPAAESVSQLPFTIL